MTTFFGNVFQLVNPATFHLTASFAPADPFVPTGVRVVAASCDTTGDGSTNVVVQWQENFVVAASSVSVSNATNTVIYKVVPASGTSLAILSADVWADVQIYADAFCAGTVACSKAASQ